MTGRSSPRTANKCLLLGAFDTLFNGRDFEAAERYWSPTYVQHSTGIAPGRDGLFALVRGLSRHYESALAMAEGNCVMVQQDEATKAASKSGLPMFGETFPE